jgi:hypothetical protein
VEIVAFRVYVYADMLEEVDEGAKGSLAQDANSDGEVDNP